MKVKGLTQKDVQRKSGGRITDGYVASITTGRATNLSVDKLIALADGLGVDADELFHVASGQEFPAAGRSANGPNSVAILEIVQNVMMSPVVTQILHEVVRLSPEERARLLEFIKGWTRSSGGRGASQNRTKPQGFFGLIGRRDAGLCRRMVPWRPGAQGNACRIPYRRRGNSRGDGGAEADGESINHNRSAGYAVGSPVCRGKLGFASSYLASVLECSVLTFLSPAYRRSDHRRPG
jgi:transcriptional regulator with XRE-family HTH domain